ncbi:hypothetical protein BD410DRAFT_789959, partial [Rickenella mellea]
MGRRSHPYIVRHISHTPRARPLLSERYPGPCVDRSLLVAVILMMNNVGSTLLYLFALSANRVR